MSEMKGFYKVWGKSLAWSWNWKHKMTFYAMKLFQYIVLAKVYDVPLLLLKYKGVDNGWVLTANGHDKNEQGGFSWEVDYL